VFDVKDLAVTYPGDICALRRTTLSFREGEFTVLLGPSGAGKSTLLRCLNGLVRPDRGSTLRADGVGAIDGHRFRLRSLRRQTGMVFQQHQLVPQRSAAQNVLLGRLAHHSPWRTLLPFPRRDWHIALDCLERVGLLDRALARVDQLSGGEQQRVGIARALAQRPRALLADEPVASLDPVTAGRILELLHGICKADGLTGIVTLHQVAFARRFADRIIGLSAGRVVFDGAPASLGEADAERIYSNPAARSAARRDPIASAVPGLAGAPGSGTCSVRPTT
jgi:phosphonate transport system ATP-binding protein